MWGIRWDNCSIWGYSKSRTITEHPNWDETHKDLKPSSQTGEAAQQKLGWQWFCLVL